MSTVAAGRGFSVNQIVTPLLSYMAAAHDFSSKLWFCIFPFTRHRSSAEAGADAPAASRARTTRGVRGIA